VADAGWDQWRAATCWPDHCFCERIRDGAIRQPANTWSSLAFVVVALMVVARARADRAPGAGAPANAMTAGAAWPFAYATALTVTGVGSAFFHASLTFVGQFVDVLGMYFIGTFILLYNVARLRPVATAAALGAYGATNAVLAALLIEAPGLRRYLFAALLAASVALEYAVRAQRPSRFDGRYFGRALALIAIAFTIWVLDITGGACDPQSLLQGHAIWHLLGAAATWYLYLYYRSEQRSPT
jgi:hypothetical protein